MEQTNDNIIKMPEGLNARDQIAWLQQQAIIQVIKDNPGLHKAIKKIKEKKRAQEGKV